MTSKGRAQACARIAEIEAGAAAERVRSREVISALIGRAERIFGRKAPRVFVERVDAALDDVDRVTQAVVRDLKEVAAEGDEAAFKDALCQARAEVRLAIREVEKVGRAALDPNRAFQ
jgi:hypothetical protein